MRHVPHEALSPARARVLEFLQQRGAPASIADVAAVFGQHPNTVREHLDALAAAGLVRRDRVAGSGRGRPAWAYSADTTVREPDPRVREHGALAGALAAHLAASSSDPAAAARAAGLSWGHRAVQAVPEQPAGDPLASVVAMLDSLGFDPRRDRDGTTVRLHACPLLDVAMEVPEVVCAVHQGMIDGACAELGHPDATITLEPFGEADACVLRQCAEQA